MLVEELLLEGNKVLHKDQVKLLLGEILNYNPLELSFHLQEQVSDLQKKKFLECLEYIKKGKPLQYALKSVNFYGLKFYIDERVLIPRFETEELVYQTNLYIKKYFSSELDVLDLCTGSGCIGLTLKYQNPTLNLVLSDLSPYALEVAQINQKRLNLDVKIVESDLFSELNSKFDIIICNPPYVSEDDEVDDLVSKNEPSLALYARNNGLEFYERILSTCENYLKDKYLIAFEIGANQKEAITKLINKYLKDVKIVSKQDLSKRDRMIFIFKNINISE